MGTLIDEWYENEAWTYFEKNIIKEDCPRAVAEYLYAKWVDSNHGIEALIKWKEELNA